MPADFENVEEVGAHLRRLEGETQGVDWASADAVRIRGRQRGQRRAIAGTMVVCLGIATLGISVTGNLPGQKGFLNTTVPIAGIPTEQRTVPEDPSQTSSTSSSSDPDGDGGTEVSDPSDEGQGGSPESPRPPGSTPTASESASPPPTDSPPTSPSDDASPTTTDSPPPSDPTPTPSLPPVDTSAVATASELPSITDGSWSELDSGDGEGKAAAVWRCAKPALTDLEARSAAWRTSEWTPASSKDGSPLQSGAASAAFSSAKTASAGYDELTGAVKDCGWGKPGAATSVTVEGGEATWWTITKNSKAHVAGLVRRGSALTYVVLDLPDADTTVSMDATLQAAGDRLGPWAN